MIVVKIVVTIVVKIVVKFVKIASIFDIVQSTSQPDFMEQQVCLAFFSISLLNRGGPVKQITLCILNSYYKVSKS